jgi:hypothetical protein
LKFYKHPVYSKFQLKNIAAIVASNDLLKLGAVKEREARAKADSTKDRAIQSGTREWNN